MGVQRSKQGPGGTRVVPVRDGEAVQELELAPLSAEASPRVERTKGVVEQERPCRRCEYNLIGSPLDGRCPECGLPVMASVSRKRHDDQMIYAPEAWLGLFAMGTGLLCGGWLLMLAASFVLFFGDFRMGLFASVPASVLWTLGVWASTCPRPPMPGSTMTYRTEWAGLRRAARWSQVGLALGLVLLLGSFTMNFARPLQAASWVLAVLLLLSGVVGVSAVFSLLSRYAGWACDDQLSIDLRTAAITGPLVVLVAGLIVASALFAGAGVLAMFLVWLPIYLALRTTLTIFRLRTMAAWALHNHRTAVLREQRAAERAARMARPRPVHDQ